MTRARSRSEIQRLCGTLLFSLGLLVFGLLVVSGLHARTFEQPDMVHLNHVLMTTLGAPVALALIAWGLVLRRGSSG